MQIFLGFVKREQSVDLGALTVKIQIDKKAVCKKQKRGSCKGAEHADPNFHSCCRANTLGVSLSVELGGVDPRARGASENRKRENKQKLSDYRNGGHRFRAQAADHYMVNKTDCVCYCVLDHDGYRKLDRPAQNILTVHNVLPLLICDRRLKALDRADQPGVSDNKIDGRRVAFGDYRALSL